MPMNLIMLNGLITLEKCKFYFGSLSYAGAFVNYDGFLHSKPKDDEDGFQLNEYDKIESNMKAIMAPISNVSQL